jgi:hypothetical protein
MIDINTVLETAPSKIARYAEVEVKHYRDMITGHEEYKRLRAKKYLEIRAQETKIPQKDVEYMLDCDPMLCKVKDDEFMSEINYRSWRNKREEADDELQCALEQGRTIRSEQRSLSNSIPREEQ